MSKMTREQAREEWWKQFGSERHRLLEILEERVLPLMTLIYPQEVFVGSDECEAETYEHVKDGYDIGIHNVRRIWNVLNELTHANKAAQKEGGK